MEAATSQFYFFLFFCEQTMMPLIKTPPQKGKLDWRDRRSISYTLTVHPVTCSNILRTNTEDTPNNAATLKTLPLHTTVLLRMVSSSRSSSVYEWIKELDSTNPGADVETNDVRFQQLKKPNCKITLQTSAPRFSCNDHKSWVSVHTGVRFARHNCCHLRNVVYNNGDLHKWRSCSMRNCKSLCVTRLMRGRPITCENKTSQFTLQNTHQPTMKWALITMAIMTDQLLPEALVSFIKLHDSKKNCAHQSRAQNSLCSSNILLLYIYKANLPNFHTYIKPIFLTNKKKQSP